MVDRVIKVIGCWARSWLLGKPCSLAGLRAPAGRHWQPSPALALALLLCSAPAGHHLALAWLVLVYEFEICSGVSPLPLGLLPGDLGPQQRLHLRKGERRGGYAPLPVGSGIFIVWDSLY